MKAFFDILKTNELIYPNTVAYGWEPENADRKQGHPYYQWFQTDQGEGIIEIGNETITLQKNDGILITPFTPHRYYSKQHWSTDCITICGYATTFFHKLLGEEKYFVLHDCTNIKHAITKLADQIDYDIPPEEVSLKTYSIFTMIRSAILESYPGASNVSPVGYEVKKYLDSHFMDKISVKQLSINYHVSPQYLINTFKQATGNTPYQYLTEKRIREAEKILVSNNDLLISEVAGLCGFESTSRFIEIFKQIKNCTPLEFRTIYYQGSDFKYE